MGSDIRLGPCAARRQLGTQRVVLPVGESQRELAGRPERRSRLPAFLQSGGIERAPQNHRFWNANRRGEGLSAAGGKGGSVKSSDRIFFGCSRFSRFAGTAHVGSALATSQRRMCSRSGWETLLAPWSSTCRHGGPSTAVPPAAGRVRCGRVGPPRVFRLMRMSAGSLGTNLTLHML